MIQLKRGSTESWKKLKTPLQDGQPGYDRDKRRLKIGDGVNLWEKLKAVGLSKEEILDSERNAKIRLREDPEGLAIMTYGTEGPDSNTVGELYLQCYEAEPEVDYVVDSGISGIWSYRKWHTGKAECFGALALDTAIQCPFENKVLYYSSNEMEHTTYPFKFASVPNESVTLQSAGNIAWIASKGKNTEGKTGKYILISPNKYDNAKYTIVFRISGRWK